MILMDLKADNFYCFNDFHINFSYPKKIVGSYIENEFLAGRKNFRYKKANILMGSNATGKTSLGRLFLSIFNFMDKKSLDLITNDIADKSVEASFSMDSVVDLDEEYRLYRTKALFLPSEEKKYTSENTIVHVDYVDIRKNDNYETASARLDAIENVRNSGNYVAELEKIVGLGWFFVFPSDKPDRVTYDEKKEAVYLKIMETVLKVLDPAILSVDKLEAVENSFVVRMKGNEVIVQDGQPAKKNVLSTGTISGIDIASMITSICIGDYGFYYCDEKFSFVHSDIERALLATMISKLKPDTQLFFTTHNYDILDMPLPKHSFNMLRKEIDNNLQRVTAVNVGDYLKKNTDSVRAAVENDLFLSAPSLDLLDIIDSL